MSHPLDRFPECPFGRVNPDNEPDYDAIEERKLREEADTLAERLEEAREWRADMQRAGLDDSLFHDLEYALAAMVPKKQKERE